jgi:hypothetical protein
LQACCLHGLQPQHYGIDVPSSNGKTGEALRFAAVQKTMRLLSLLCLFAFTISTAAAADPAADMTSFSVFNNINVAELA